MLRFEQRDKLAELPEDLLESGRDDFFNSPSNSQQSNTGVLIHQAITEQAAADITGYIIQYMRRMLRSGALKGIKFGHMWLIDMKSLGKYFKHVEQTSDRRFGPK
jgi:hypothetical protein